MFWGGDNLLFKVTTENDTTRDGSKFIKALNGFHSSVVLDGEASGNSLKGRHGDIGKLLVVDERKIITNLSQVGSDEGGKLAVVVELDGLRNLLELGSLEGLDVGNLHLRGELELVHGDLHVVAVAADDKLTSDVDKVGVERGHLSVVVDSEVLDGGDAQATQITDEGIGDLNALNLSNTLSTEVQVVELGKLDQGDGANRLERGHLQCAQEFEVIEGKVATNGVDAGRGDGDDAGSIVDDQITLDLLDAIENQITRNIGIDGNITIDNIAVQRGSRLCNLDIRGASGGCQQMSVFYVGGTIEKRVIPETAVAPSARMAEKTLTECIMACRAGECQFWV